MTRLSDLVDAGPPPGHAHLDRMTERMHRLQPILRSLTGDGVRRTLAIVGESLPMHVHEVPSGTSAHDWTVPQEWNVRAAHITHADGRRVIDLADHHLHLVGYSTPVRERLSLDELRPHLHTLPEHPDWIPYRTSYYHPDWGFCLSQRQLDAMDDGPYDIVIDSTLTPGSLSYGEIFLPGESDTEVLVSSHVCHPAMANDNLSGITVAAELAHVLAQLPTRRLSYRFVFAPGTIGSLVWLSRNAAALPRIGHGLVLTGLGGPGPLTYKATRRGDRSIDDAARHVVSRAAGELIDYAPWGYDERQFNSLGFDLPVGRLTRTPHGEYPEYHTSADGLELVTGDHLDEALWALLRIFDVLENDDRYVNLQPHGEPQLGRRGLYPTTGGRSADETTLAMLWALGLSDGTTSILQVAQRADLDFACLRRASSRLEGAGLLQRSSSP